jgi:hypothetical protein
MRTSVFAAIAASSSLGASALAGLVNPLIAPWAGGASAQFAQWDSFSSAYGGVNAPDAVGSSPFSLINFSPDAVLASSGNIYGPSSPLYVMIMGGTRGGQTPLQIILNVATAGTFIPQGGVRLSLFDNQGNSMSLSPAATEIRSEAPTPPQGAARTTAYTWNTASMPFMATGFRIEITGGPGNMALDAVRLDLNYTAVPGPGAIVLMGIAAMQTRRRRA